MKLGFAKQEITPPVGTELGGYAGHRPCGGVHDPLWCKAVVLEQAGQRFALVVMDMLSVDESFVHAVAETLVPLGICEERLILAAIHSHASVCGMIPGEGPLGEINRVGQADPEGFLAYMQMAIDAAVLACGEALEGMEPFRVRAARGKLPVIGSERHTGAPAQGELTALQCLLESGRSVILWQVPCHPTVLGPDNLLASADFLAGVEDRLEADMAVFLGGAAGDISTRFTRREATFRECERFAGFAAQAVTDLLTEAVYAQPAPLWGLRKHIRLKARPVEAPVQCRERLRQAQQRWETAKEAGADPKELRILRSYVEGAGVELEMAALLEGVDRFELPVAAFTFGGLAFVTVPGELFSDLRPENAVPICYAGGYYRYIAPKTAYDRGYYEAMASILDRGAGEAFCEELILILNRNL